VQVVIPFEITLDRVAKQGATQQQNAYANHEYPCAEGPYMDHCTATRIWTIALQRALRQLSTAISTGRRNTRTKPCCLVFRPEGFAGESEGLAKQTLPIIERTAQIVD